MATSNFQQDLQNSKSRVQLRQQVLSSRSVSRDARESAWMRFKCKEQDPPGIAKADLKTEQSPTKDEELSASPNEELSQELKSVKNKGAYLEEKLEELGDITSPTISETILPVAATAIATPISPITPSTVCSAAPSTGSIQSVFVNTTFNTGVSKIASSEFVFPKLKERDKKLSSEASAKSTFAPESLYLCVLLMAACFTAQHFQILEEFSFQKAPRLRIRSQVGNC